MPSNHLTLCRPLLLLPSILPSIRVFSNESALLSSVTLINYLPSLHLGCFWFFDYKWYNSVYFIGCVHACSVMKSCPTFCDPMDCSLPGSSVHGFPGKNTGVGCHFLHQRIFPTQGSNPSLQHWEADSLPVNHLGSPSLGSSAH